MSDPDLALLRARAQEAFAMYETTESRQSVPSEKRDLMGFMLAGDVLTLVEYVDRLRAS